MASDTKWTINTDTSAWRGVSWGDATGTTTTSKTRADPCCDPCPDCGGLECYCRPRFFAGQLLTEKELNGLQDYVIAKNKLHNRHLVGAGIVCGLEARNAGKRMSRIAGPTRRERTTAPMSSRTGFSPSAMPKRPPAMNRRQPRRVPAAAAVRDRRAVAAAAAPAPKAVAAADARRRRQNQ
jgi:hypothetical protein